MDGPPEEEFAPTHSIFQSSLNLTSSMKKNDTTNLNLPAGLAPPKKMRLCSRGTGEVIHVLHFKALPERLQDFEETIQALSHSLHNLHSGITDLRICNPSNREVCFIITFLSEDDKQRFQLGPQLDAQEVLADMIEGGTPSFELSGSLMPDTHTLPSLLEYLKTHVNGLSHTAHDVRAVQKEMKKWFPRRSEYEKYIHWDLECPEKYTRNLVFHNEHMDVILMCWPPGAASSIHDHANSSCWVSVVEGVVHEVQYIMPQLDRQFIETEMRNPTGAVGRCGKLNLLGEAALQPRGCTSTYANNDIGIHRVENRTKEPAYTLHVYAPPLTKMKIFKENGEVSVFNVARMPFTSIEGERSSVGVIDVHAWNFNQCRYST